MRPPLWFFIAAGVMVLAGLLVSLFTQAAFDFRLLNIYFVVNAGHVIMGAAVFLFALPGLVYLLVKRARPGTGFHWIPVTHFFMSALSGLGFISLVILAFNPGDYILLNRGMQLNLVMPLMGYILMFWFVVTVMRKKKKENA